MSLLGDYTVDAVDNYTYSTWVRELYVFADAGVLMKKMQELTFGWFKTYFLRKHPNDRLLAIKQDNSPNEHGQASFLYAHRPMTSREMTIHEGLKSAVKRTTDTDDIDPQFLMVDEEFTEQEWIEERKLLTYD